MHVDKSQLLEYIMNPGALAYQPDTELLQEVTRQYPYFQSAHLLLTLAYHQTDSIRFDQALRKTALYAVDREVLYRLVHHSKKTDLSIQAKSSKQDEELQELDALINQSHQAIPTDQLLEEINQSNPGYASSSNQPNVDENGEANANQNPSNEGFSFLDWLEKFGNGNQTRAKTPSAQVSDNNVSNQNPQEKFDQASSKARQKPKDKPKNKQKVILDQFLANPPKLKRPKSEFYNPDEMAQRSVKEDDELVSEPLAEIHFEQGNYKKAIQIYEKLSLLYPDNFHYFANQIASVKRHQNS